MNKALLKLKLIYAVGGVILGAGTLLSCAFCLADSLWKLCFFPFYFSPQGDNTRTWAGKVGLWIVEKAATVAYGMAEKAFSRYVAASLTIK